MKEFSKTIELRGHIIDSLILPKVYDEIIDRGGNYSSDEIIIGKTKKNISYARLKVTAPDQKLLENILDRLHELGAIIKEEEDVVLRVAKKDGVFPEGFYSTTNLDTYINHKNKWIKVKNISMDCGIRVDNKHIKAESLKMIDVKKGDKFVVGIKGVRLNLPEQPKKKGVFEFMSSGISSEKPKGVIIKRIAEEITELKKDKSAKVLFVCGPAIIHTGSRKYLINLINKGYLDILFAGNALAVHDIEASLYGTSLGVSLEKGVVTPGGHRHHLRAINTIREAGGIKKSIKKGILKSGIMYSCVKNKCDFLLAGSIRDDGPLPEVITDIISAQKEMKRKLKGVKLVVMVSTMLHSIAVGNLLSANVRTICVDIDPAVVTKLTDRGTIQATGIIIDVETFLRELCDNMP
ncbi:MAG: TIGR00300 family protein [Nitrospinota bacterium]|jgi:lysine-ketoglutarate reductase/saccharopine dehydrogenase-like protein (TIGR00300 family)|nr:TIGR00300 family protein [Nitrospinota bacterium]HJN02704.1 TIGR00300 family protein [Nitrospinota bacterium]